MMLRRPCLCHAYDFTLLRIMRRKWWHGKFSVLTARKHSDLYPNSLAACVRMMLSACAPPPAFRGFYGRIYFAAQAWTFGLSHLLHASILSARLPKSR